MNERIKQLAEQAGFSFKYKTAPDELNPGHKLQDLEKFAELIVRECMEICRSDDWEDQQAWGKFYAHQIKKHFEIK